MHVAIIGCGDVGINAGIRLQSAGFAVTGVRRSADGIAAIREAGLSAHQADVTDAAARQSLPDADVVVYSVSVGRGGAQSARDVYVDALAAVIETYAARPHPPNRLVYTSSTGVYGDHGGAWVDENTPPRPAGERGRTLLEAEALAIDETTAHGIDGTVLRFGGLYGPGRYGIDRYLTGPVTDGYRNSTHIDDAAGAIAHLLATRRGHDEVVLVVDDEPVDRWEFASWLADRCGVSQPALHRVDERLEAGVSSPVVAERLRSNKRCRNDRLTDLGYELEVPTVWEGYEPAIETYR